MGGIFDEFVMLARMKAGDNSILVPIIANMISPVLFSLPLMKASATEKELALLGTSQGNAATLLMTGGSGDVRGPREGDRDELCGPTVDTIVNVRACV